MPSDVALVRSRFVSWCSPGPGFRAQQDPRGALDAQIGRIFQSPDYQVPRFGPARWLPDGTAYTTVEKSPDRLTHGTSCATRRGPVRACILIARVEAGAPGRVQGTRH
jgi:hypothetical protein